MKKRYVFNFIIVCLLLAFTYLYKFFIFKKFMGLSQCIAACFFTLLLFFIILVYGFRKSKLNETKKNILTFIFISFGFYFVAIYGLGFVLGFLKNPYSLSFNNIFSNIIFILIISITTELIRYCLIKSNEDKRIWQYIITIALCLFDIVFSMNNYNFLDAYHIFAFITSIVIPSVIKNFTLSYIAREVGYVPILTYAIIFNTYNYIIPVVPDLGDYLISTFNIVLPVFIYLFSSRIIFNHENKPEREFLSSGFSLSDIPILLVIVGLTYLISGIGTFQVIGIASYSMLPTITRGDAVVIEKINNKSNLKKGDIISYNRDNKRIVHRIVKCNKTAKYCITKGDQNKTNDNLKVDYSSIEGKVLFKIRFIAFPSLWLSELFS